eukprot:1785769-Pyramimonas_sp.AAC.1
MPTTSSRRPTPLFHTRCMFTSTYIKDGSAFCSHLATCAPTLRLCLASARALETEVIDLPLCFRRHPRRASSTTPRR